jgi:hypothetical protein
MRFSKNSVSIAIRNLSQEVIVARLSGVKYMICDDLIEDNIVGSIFVWPLLMAPKNIVERFMFDRGFSRVHGEFPAFDVEKNELIFFLVESILGANIRVICSGAEVVSS